ncbi:DNA-3-methyladenine glycosylase 2 family protein [Gellertiella hungarica]|uniref:DNA-3-methyladenine glycosylase II n=1 Tax=Gellertiella hungarica TaxID=1572859 RepID=A0A7W6NK61_9HYPH|nr:DNA-3-methyladenine glycosylase II [Gellertiella hungarica]
MAEPVLDPPFGAALDRLAARDPALIPIIEAAGPLPERPGRAGFAGLASVVVSQLVSRRSAEAIWQRLVDETGTLDAVRFIALAKGHGPRLGLTAAKADCLSKLAEAILNGKLDLEAVGRLPADQAISALTALKGIGPWTAEVHLLFNAGHPDIFPSGDLALRIAVGRALGIGDRPAAALVSAIARRWSPDRSVAARLFWAFYGRHLAPAADTLP